MRNYIWRDPKPDGSPPNNWVSVFGGSAWQYDETTKQYYLHTFATGQPDLNWRNKAVVDEMLDVLRFWLEIGVDGFRVDAIYFLFKDEMFLDEPLNPTYQIGIDEPYDQLLHPYTFALPEVLEMLQQFVEVLEEYDNKFMVTEACISVKDLIAMYQTISKAWFAPFNFSFIMLPWQANIHKQFVDEYDEATGQLYIPVYVMGNHDKPRIATRVGKEQARIAAMLLLTLRCIPFMYYGDEIGMQNVAIPKDKVQDPWEINMPGLQFGRDPQRTPMQWDSTLYAGFSQQDSWLPLSQNYHSINVEIQKNDPTSLFSLYKRLIKLRKQSQALSYGKYLSIDVKNEDVYAYTRVFDTEHLFIVLNVSDKNQSLSSTYEIGIVLCHSLLEIPEGTTMFLKSLVLKPSEGYVFLITK